MLTFLHSPNGFMPLSTPATDLQVELLSYNQVAL
jgi:hypothetical protein